MENKSKERSNYWATIVYPESAPDDWLEILKDFKVPALISPLHDLDCDNDGVLKKSHYHVIICYPSLKTQRQAEKIVSAINGVGTIEVVAIGSYVRYLTHMDNPEKAQYDIEDVVSVGGADYLKLMGKVESDKYKAIAEMIEYCMENDIHSYAELLLYAKNSRYDWFKVLCGKSTNTIMYFLRSMTWSSKRKYTDTHKGDD